MDACCTENKKRQLTSLAVGRKILGGKLNYFRFPDVEDIDLNLQLQCMGVCHKIKPTYKPTHVHISISKSPTMSIGSIKLLVN